MTKADINEKWGKTHKTPWNNTPGAEQLIVKTYTYTEGPAHEETTNAVQAMRWHRMGRRVTVCGRRPDGGQYHVTIQGAAKPAQEDENREACKHIALGLEAHAYGTAYRCPDCGEDICLPDDVGDKYKCPACGAVSDVSDMEQLSLWDYFTDALDIEYRIGSDRETVRSVKIMVAWGGPNIYIDTANCAVELYWWGDRASYPINRDVCGQIDDWAQELWGC